MEFDATACGFLLLQFYRQLGLMSVSIACREKMGNNARGLSPLSAVKPFAPNSTCNIVRLATARHLKCRLS